MTLAAPGEASLPSKKAFGLDPVLLQYVPATQEGLPGTSPKQVPINGGSGTIFETDLFKGRVAFRMTGLKSSPAQLFPGKQRKTHLVVQGKFKQALPFDDVLTGQQFDHPLANLPAPWLLSGLIAVARKINPSLTIGNLAAPCILAPIVTAAQCIHVAREGQQPAIDSTPVEDMSLLGCREFTSSKGHPLTFDQRKLLFGDASRRRAHTFDAEHVRPRKLLPVCSFEYKWWEQV
ncbi:hypothetical protein WJX72_010798 [[Myrmecia] bisecta]|uniref:Domain of unknown function at the cortex 1 domain-containing protein n=1 Tax=[Myrmecia] bisecta TaxID=41462 RepID=A0AAW1QGB8_9CHLO